MIRRMNGALPLTILLVLAVPQQVVGQDVTVDSTQKPTLPPEPKPTLTVRPKRISESVEQGTVKVIESAFTITKSNGVGSDVEWSVGGLPPWLRGKPSRGILNAENLKAVVALTVDAKGLEPGTVEGEVRIDASTATNSPVSIPFAFTISPTPPELTVDRIKWETTLERGKYKTIDVKVANVGGMTVKWTAESEPAGLTVRPRSGSLEANGSATLFLTAHAALLPEGTTQGELVITAPGAKNSPTTIPVVVDVMQPDGENAEKPKQIGLGVRASYLLPQSQKKKEEFEAAPVIGVFYRSPLPEAQNAFLGYEIALEFGQSESDIGESRFIVVRGAGLVYLGKNRTFHLLGGASFVREDLTDNAAGGIGGATGGVTLDVGFGATFAREQLGVRLTYTLLLDSDNVNGLLGIALAANF